MNDFEEKALRKERADIRAYSSAGLAWAPKVAWYAVRCRPGSQQYSSMVDLPADGRRDDRCRVERDLARAGIEAFIPTERFAAIHHRTRKLIDRRKPMFQGYAFVNLPGRNFSSVEEDVETVSAFVRPGNNKNEMPILFPEGLIARIRFAEFELEQEFLRGLAYRRLKAEAFAEMKKGKPTRADLAAMFPKGSKVILSRNSPVYRFPAVALSVTSRGAIRAMVETLSGNRPMDIPLEQISEVM